MSGLPTTVKHIARSLTRCRNRSEVIGRLLRGLPPTRVVLRDGTVLHAPENSTLLSLVQEIFVRQLYTPAGYELGPHDVVLDVGANIGTFTVFAAREPGRRVYSIEPFPENAAFVRRNVEANGLRNVEVVEAAAAGESGTTDLFISRLSGGHLLFDHNVRGTLGEAILVPTVTIGELMERFGLDRVNFLKLDCEGSEGDVLRTAGPDVLGRIDRLAMEFHDNVSPLRHEEIVALLTDAGFSTRLRWNGTSAFGYVYATRRSA